MKPAAVAAVVFRFYLLCSARFSCYAAQRFNSGDKPRLVLRKRPILDVETHPSRDVPGRLVSLHWRCVRRMCVLVCSATPTSILTSGFFGSSLYWTRTFTENCVYRVRTRRYEAPVSIRGQRAAVLPAHPMSGTLAYFSALQ